MSASVSQPHGVLTPESAARIAEGVEAETGHGGAVEAHPVVAGASMVSTPETVTGSAVPAHQAPTTPAPAKPSPAPVPDGPKTPPAAPAPAVVNVNVAPSK